MAPSSGNIWFSLPASVFHRLHAVDVVRKSSGICYILLLG